MAKRKKRKHKNNRRKFVTQKKSFSWKKFSFWFVAYLIFITLLTLLFEKTQIYQNKIGFYIIMGYLLTLLSRVLYSATKSRNLRLNGIIVWGLIYTVVFGVLDYLFIIFPQIQINPSLDKYVVIFLFSLVFTLIIMFLRRMKIKSGKRSFKSPSQIFSGIILLVFGILFFRFSHIIFLQWFNWPEGMAWSWLIGLGFLIAGFLTLIAWWRNNVLSAGKQFGFAIGKKHKI